MVVVEGVSGELRYYDVQSGVYSELDEPAPTYSPGNSSLFRCHTVTHDDVPTLSMKLQPAIRPFPVLGFWRKNTMPYAGIMAYRRYFLSSTSI